MPTNKQPLSVRLIDAINDVIDSGFKDIYYDAKMDSADEAPSEYTLGVAKHNDNLLKLRTLLGQLPQTDPLDITGISNVNRYRFGRAAVQFGTPDIGANGDDIEGQESDLTDTLANIMHYCHSEKIDFNRALSRAQMHFNEEKDN